MSESIASFNAGTETTPEFEGQSNMPNGYENLERIEVYKKSDGSEGLRGVIKLGVDDGAKEHSFILKDEDYELWGFDPEQKFEPQPVKAIWQNEGNNIPVIVTGFHGVKDDMTYYTIEGSNTGIPHDQIVWGEAPTPPSDVESSPEYKALLERFEALESRYSDLEAKYQELERKYNDLPDAEDLRADNQRLSTEVATLTSRNQELEDRNEFLEGRNKELEADNQRLASEAQSLTRERDDLIISNQHLREEFIGLRQSGVSQEIVWYRRPINWLGGIAAAAALVGTGIAIANHHELEELEHQKPIPQKTINYNYRQNESGGQSFSGGGGSDLNGLNIEYYNPETKVTGVALTRDTKLRLKKLSDGKFILTNGRKTIDIKWDSQGKVDYNTRHLLKANHYKMAWSANGQDGKRKITIVSE